MSVCLGAFRCAAIRHSFAHDQRYVETMRRKDWREAMMSAGYDLSAELALLRRVRRRDAALVRHHGVTDQTSSSQKHHSGVLGRSTTRSSFPR